MDWSSATITRAGAARINQCLTEGEALTVTAVRAGSGVHQGDLAGATRMVNIVQTAAILRVETYLTGRRIHIQIASSGLETGYQLRQVGIFADDGAGGEVLLMIMQDADGIPIPSGTEMPQFVLTLRAVAEIAPAVDLEIRQVALVGPVRGIVTPEMFGARGDGVTDDSLALADALAAAGEGGTVMLEPTGTYLVTETLHMQDGQTLDGNGATLLWRGEPTYDGSVIRSAPYIMLAEGSLGTEIPITEAPTAVNGGSSTSGGAANPYGFITVKVGQDPGLEPGDRIIIQAARNALAPESGDYWCGTPTGNASTAYWAEPLIVNDVSKTGTAEWTLRCVGSLIYPYYLPDPEEGVDISAALTEARYADTKALAGYVVRQGATPWHRAHSTIRKADFLRGVTVRRLRVLAQGTAHSGDTASAVSGAWKGIDTANTIRLTLCEGALVEDVEIIASDMGRGLMLDNCWRSGFSRCRFETDYTMYSAAETHVYVNALSFSSCWECSADRCETVRAGQSFDVAYGSAVRCPAVSIAIRDCTVTQSMDNAATCHSGGWGYSLDRCRFIGCAQPVLVRSPMTAVRDCVFAGWAGSPPVGGSGYYTNRDKPHVTFSEPTVQGSFVDGCRVEGGKGIRIAPWLIRAFNFAAGNYLTEVSYVGPGEDPDYPGGYVIPAETSGAIAPPPRKNLGIRVRGNTFLACEMALWMSRPEPWLYADSGDLTDYALDDLGVVFEDNDLIGCGGHNWPVYADRMTNGCSFRGNRFVRCVGAGYKKDDGTLTATPDLIHFAGDNVRMRVEDNMADRCGGSFVRMFNNLATVDMELLTGGTPQFSSRGNQIHGCETGFAVSSEEEDLEVRYLQDGRRKAASMVADSSGDRNTSANRCGLAYDFDAGTMDLYTIGAPRVTVTPTALRTEKEYLAPGCLLRGWFRLVAGQASSAQFRVALYDYPVTEAEFRQICACWDAGEDDQGNAVSFGGQVTLLVFVDSEDPDQPPGFRWKRFPPPVNGGLGLVEHSSMYIGGQRIYSVNAQTGMISYALSAEDAPATAVSPAVFFSVPSGFTPSASLSYYLFAEVLENLTGQSIRFNSLSTADTPEMFHTAYASRTDQHAAPAEGLGDIYAWDFIYPGGAQLDLGTAEIPWGQVYAEGLTLGGTTISEAQMQALLALLS